MKDMAEERVTADTELGTNRSRDLLLRPIPANVGHSHLFVPVGFLVCIGLIRQTVRA